GEVHKRQTVTSRMYRMAQRGLVSGVPGKKGVYTLAEQSEPEPTEYDLLDDDEDDILLVSTFGGEGKAPVPE
ncbi:MAG: hypothetical protein MJA32_01705, partial [Proteobacteria bacterium]|nr:hypothetical protein [Pseudomonadota bacterium]